VALDRQTFPFLVLNQKERSMKKMKRRRKTRRLTMIWQVPLHLLRPTYNIVSLLLRSLPEKRHGTGTGTTVSQRPYYGPKYSRLYPVVH
jgi:hypothetical protein